MKRVLLALVLATFASSALADRDDFRGGYHGGGHYEHYYHGGGHGGGGNDWLAPLIIGGVAGYVLAQPPRTVVQQPVIIQQAPVVVPAPPYGYHYETVVDANCNCYRTILVSNY